MLYREIIAVCSQIHTKHINTQCGQNVVFMNVKLLVHVVTTGLWIVYTYSNIGPSVLKETKFERSEINRSPCCRLCRSFTDVTLCGQTLVRGSVPCPLIFKWANHRTGRTSLRDWIAEHVDLWRGWKHLEIGVSLPTVLFWFAYKHPSVLFCTGFTKFFLYWNTFRNLQIVSCIWYSPLK